MENFVVVYQYGKVASTAIVKALNEISEVRAVQTHFLGKDTFIHVLNQILDPYESDYFTFHRRGQLFENIDFMRNIYKHQAGLVQDSQMVFLTVVREPVSWFRSAITQDAKGYLPMLQALQAEDENSEIDPAECLESGLSRILSVMIAALKEAGGIEAYMRDSTRLKLPLGDTVEGKLVGIFLDLFKRPFAWISREFEAVVGVELGAMQQCAPFVFKATFDWGSAYVIRFEDLEKSLELVMNELGLGGKLVLGRENISSDKPYSQSVSKLFTPEVIQELKQLGRGNYQRVLGYE